MILSMKQVTKLSRSKVRTHVSATQIKNSKIQPGDYEIETAENLLKVAGFTEPEEFEALAERDDFNIFVGPDSKAPGGMVFEAKWMPTVNRVRLYLPGDEVVYLTVKGAPWRGIWYRAIRSSLTRAMNPATSPEVDKYWFECTGWNTLDRVWEYSKAK